MRLLIVEDEIDLCDTVAEGLRLDGYAVDTAYDGEEASLLAAIESYDLLLLDLNLPGIDGFSLLKELRKTNTELRILILSARGSITDKVTGLDLGANDYLVKPFDFEELEARIRALLRRSFHSEDSLLTFEALTLNTALRTVHAGEQELILTKKELSILEYLMSNPSRVISQEELLAHVCDINADSFSNSIRVHIASLRKKLRSALSYDPIQTKIGEGYFLSKKEISHA